MLSFARLHSAPCLAVLTAMLLTGCASSGPNHVYLSTKGSPAVQDMGETAVQLTHAVAPGERVLGLAYDFNTDHLFLRITPAQVIRVIERPSGKTLREMPLPSALHTEESADLAIRSSDRHLFAVQPHQPVVAELTLFGRPVRTIKLSGLPGPIDGLACDQRQSRLVVLTGGTVHFFSYEGRELGAVTLDHAASSLSLGYDSDAGHFFVPLADGQSVGEFDADGHLIRSLSALGVTAVDAGPRSFVRVF